MQINNISQNSVYGVMPRADTEKKGGRACSRGEKGSPEKKRRVRPERGGRGYRLIFPAKGGARGAVGKLYLQHRQGR